MDKNSILTWTSWNLNEAKSANRSVKDLSAKKKAKQGKQPSRREFLKTIFKTAATTAATILALKTLYKALQDSYTPFSVTMVAVESLNLSSAAKKFLFKAYGSVIPNFEQRLIETEFEVAGSLYGSKIMMNQKMYDAIIMFTLRVGVKKFKKSKFLASIKKSDWKEALEQLKKDNTQTWTIPAGDDIKKWEINLFSTWDSEVHDVELAQIEIDDTTPDTNMVRLLNRIATSYIGQEEISGNKGFYDKSFENKMRDIGWKPGHAWCCYFQELVFKEAFEKQPDLWNKMERLFHGNTIRTYMNFSLSRYFKVGQTPRPGALAVWRYSVTRGHIGLVTSVNGNQFTTIEGNTTRSGGAEGTHVMKKTRTRDQGYLKLLGFIYII